MASYRRTSLHQGSNMVCVQGISLQDRSHNKESISAMPAVEPLDCDYRARRTRAPRRSGPQDSITTATRTTTTNDHHHTTTRTAHHDQRDHHHHPHHDAGSSTQTNPTPVSERHCKAGAQLSQEKWRRLAGRGCRSSVGPVKTLSTSSVLKSPVPRLHLGHHTDGAERPNSVAAPGRFADKHDANALNLQVPRISGGRGRSRTVNTSGLFARKCVPCHSGSLVLPRAAHPNIMVPFCPYDGPLNSGFMGP